MRRILTAIFLTLVIATTALGAGKNKRIEILDAVTVSTAGGVETVTFNNPTASSMYLIVVTSAEVATASLTVAVSVDADEFTAVPICTSAAITTETTYFMAVGTLAAAGGDIDLACDFPISRRTTVTFTVTGAGASFDISADAELLADSAP
jgi:hypothetical protein